MFQEYALAAGEMTGGREVDPRATAVRRLLTVEGERDGIRSLGQTLAAEDRGPNPQLFMRPTTSRPGRPLRLFSGKRWANQSTRWSGT